MAPIINTDDPRAIKLLDAADVKYTIEAPERSQLVIPASDFWTIPNVSYRDNVSAWDLSKKLLPSRTQQQHAEHRNSAQKGEFVTADMPLYHAIFDALYEQRHALEFTETARSFIQNAMRQRFPNTLTRIAYSQKGKDTVIHNYGTKDSYQIKTNIVGPNRFIKSKDKRALTALLGTGNIDRINQVYIWINGTNAFIYRFNEKPQELTQAVAWFDALPDDARLYCSGRPDYAYASLGVRANARSASKK